MRNAVLGISSREGVSRQIENIVYLELIRRGYEVAVGKYGDRRSISPHAEAMTSSTYRSPCP